LAEKQSEEVVSSVKAVLPLTIIKLTESLVSTAEKGSRNRVADSAKRMASIRTKFS
jgi:hypothetical protein